MGERWTYSRIWVFVSANSDVSRAFARLQYGHHVFEKMVIVLLEIAFYVDRHRLSAREAASHGSTKAHLYGILYCHDFALVR